MVFSQNKSPATYLCCNVILTFFPALFVITLATFI